MMKSGLFKQLVGCWTLIELIEVRLSTGAITFPTGEDPKGLIMYHPDGFMSAQIMRATSNADDVQYVPGNPVYLAYAGPFEVNDENNSVRHTMFVSLFADWRGETQIRKVRFENNLLHLESGQPFLVNGIQVIHRLTWKKIEQADFKL